MSTAKKPSRKAAEASQELVTAVKSGDRLKILIVLRDLIAERLQKTNSCRDTASLSKRLMQVVDEIEALEKQKKAAEEKPFDMNDFRKKYHLADMSIEHEAN